MHILLSSLLLMMSPVDADAGVTTTDAKIIQGVVASSTLKMTTTFGSATIDSDEIVSIEFGTPDIVTVTGDTVLRGSLQLDALNLRTESGTKTVQRGEMQSIQFSRNASLVAGTITNGVHWNGSTYHLRAPEHFDPTKRYPALVFLHGIPSNSAMFIRGICARWPDIGERYILIGVNGTMVHESSTPEVPRYFYTFVEFAGRSTYDPVPGAERQSPLLVAEVVAGLRKRLPITKVIVTGHSQGGFMTYSTFMNYPELFDGALPSAGGMTRFARVDAFTDESLRARQRSIPVAIIHATNDDVIEFSEATEALAAMQRGGFEQVRLFQNDEAGHQFLRLPFDQALAWLEQVMGNDTSGGR